MDDQSNDNELQRIYQDLLETLSQASPIAITAADIQGNITFASAATAALHGFPSREAVLGRATSELLAPEEHDRAKKNTLKALEEGRVTSIRYKMLRRDGSTFPADLSAAVLRGRDGRPLGFVATVQDVTLQLAEQIELRETRDTYQQLVELCPDPVVVLQDGLYRYVNAAYTSVFGYTRKDVEAGLSFYALVQDSDLAAVRAQYEARTDGKEVPRTFRIDLLTKLGDRVACETSAALIQHEGRPADLVIIRDITERVEAQNALEAHADELAQANARLADANAQLERLGRAKDEFVATVSHELRTPLVTGLGYLDLLLGGNLGEISTLALERVRVARNNLLRLAGLIDGILDYHALVTAGAPGRLVLRPFALDRLCTETVRDFRIRTQCEESHISLNLPEVTPSGSGSPEILRRVLDNLLNNAHQHAGPTARIRLSVEHVEPGQVEVTVQDDGPGVPATMQERIFEPFVKADVSTAGTGLGLAIVQQLLQLHDTAPRLRSGESGTAISFTLAVSESAPDEHRHPNPDTSEQVLKPLRGRLLMVEDDADTREFLELLLLGAGLEVVQASSAEMALEWLREARPDLMLVDVSLPGMSGVSFCDLVKNASATADIPVCMYTARAEAQSRAHAARCDAYLVKPVAPEIILSTLRQLLDR